MSGAIQEAAIWQRGQGSDDMREAKRDPRDMLSEALRGLGIDPESVMILPKLKLEAGIFGDPAAHDIRPKLYDETDVAGPDDRAENELGHWKRRAKTADLELQEAMQAKERAERFWRFWKNIAKARGSQIKEMDGMIDDLISLPSND